MFKAIDNAYHAMLPKSGYPFAMLHLHVDPATIDVNVHPAKTEIKFSDEQAVYRAIYHSIVTALVAQEKPEAIAKTIGVDVGAVPKGGPQEKATSQSATRTAPLSGEPLVWGARPQEGGKTTTVGAVPKGGPQGEKATSVGAVPEGGPQRTAPAGPQEKTTSQSAARTAPAGLSVWAAGLNPPADGPDRAQKGLSGEPLADGPDRAQKGLLGESPAWGARQERGGADQPSLFSQALAQHGQGGPS